MSSEHKTQTLFVIAILALALLRCDGNRSPEVDTYDTASFDAIGDEGEETDVVRDPNDVATNDDIEADVNSEPECIIPGPGLDRRSCFYSRCIGPPMEPLRKWCASSPLDDGALCCDSKWNRPWVAGDGYWYMTHPQCEDNPATRYPTCPFYEEDGVTFYGQGVD